MIRHSTVAVRRSLSSRSTIASQPLPLAGSLVVGVGSLKDFFDSE
jgi:hypothetical protein